MQLGEDVKEGREKEGRERRCGFHCPSEHNECTIG